ncbi:MAG: hypothetical protein AAGI66_00910 [Cyanobacteria bacterium P01_H01_bin.74]
MQVSFSHNARFVRPENKVSGQQRSPRFQGKSLAAALVDDGPMTLVILDLVAMVFPRTAEAAVMRGPDDARETFLREVFGTLANMFVMGIASSGLMKLAGRSVNKLNPKGIPAQAFVEASNLDVFSAVYKNILAQSNSPAAARKEFIDTVLSGMQSTDIQSSLNTRLHSIQVLKDFPEEQRALLKQTFLQVDKPLEDNAAEILRQGLTHSDETMASKHFDAVHQTLKNAGWGKFSRSARNRLAKIYHDNAYSLDCKVQEAFQKTTGQPVDPESEEFIVRRLQLSLSQLQSKAKQPSVIQNLSNQLDYLAHQSGMTSTVNLITDAGTSKSKGRISILTELHHFLTQFVDRTAYAVSHHKLNSKQWKTAIADKLYSGEDQGLLIKKSLGLVAAAKKAKGLYTWLPILITLATSGSLVFFNNWYTRHKYGGKIFFPGEGIPTPTKAKHNTKKHAPPEQCNNIPQTSPDEQVKSVQALYSPPAFTAQPPLYCYPSPGAAGAFLQQPLKSMPLLPARPSVLRANGYTPALLYPPATYQAQSATSWRVS